MINVAVQVKLVDSDFWLDLYDDTIELRDCLEVFNAMAMQSEDCLMQIVEFELERIVVENTRLFQIGHERSFEINTPYSGFRYIFTAVTPLDFEAFVLNVGVYAYAMAEICSEEVRSFIVS